jgi:hypothetical protein
MGSSRGGISAARYFMEGARKLTYKLAYFCHLRLFLFILSKILLSAKAEIGRAHV